MRFREGETGRYRPGARLISLVGGALTAAGIGQAGFIPFFGKLDGRNQDSDRLHRSRKVLLAHLDPVESSRLIDFHAIPLRNTEDDCF